MSYAPNVWHHPLLVRRPQEFLITDRAAPAGEADSANLQEHWEASPVAVVEL